MLHHQFHGRLLLDFKIFKETESLPANEGEIGAPAFPDLLLDRGGVVGINVIPGFSGLANLKISSPRHY